MANIKATERIFVYNLVNMTISVIWLNVFSLLLSLLFHSNLSHITWPGSEAGHDRHCRSCWWTSIEYNVFNSLNQKHIVF